MNKIMKKHIYIISILLLLPFTAFTQQDLDNYLVIAAENNPGLRVKFKEYMAALEVAPQIQAFYDRLDLPPDSFDFEVGNGGHEVFLAGSLAFLNWWIGPDVFD